MVDSGALIDWAKKFLAQRAAGYAKRVISGEYILRAPAGPVFLEGGVRCGGFVRLLYPDSCPLANKGWRTAVSVYSPQIVLSPRLRLLTLMLRACY